MDSPGEGSAGLTDAAAALESGYFDAVGAELAATSRPQFGRSGQTSIGREIVDYVRENSRQLREHFLFAQTGLARQIADRLLPEHGAKLRWLDGLILALANPRVDRGGLTAILKFLNQVA
jgi:hypothetical protein